MTQTVRIDDGPSLARALLDLARQRHISLAEADLATIRELLGELLLLAAGPQ